MDENEKTDTQIHRLRHSAAHLLAQAVKQLYPDTKLGIGPVIENGFYYDFLRKEPFTPEDLQKITARIKELARKAQPITKVSLDTITKKKYLAEEPLKKELTKEFEAKKETVTFYGQGEFIDLCHGPHVENTKELKHVALLRTSGAYWKGDAKNVQLQRIYGTAWETKEELDAYLKTLEDAEKYNHKKLGEELELFTHFDLVGKGLPVWLPKGEIVRQEIEKFAIETEQAAGYIRVRTPHLARKELFVRSGHLPYYAETMYPAMVTDDGEYYLKAMNCPIHHLIFSRKVRSYRELPLRIAEYGTVYRNELSGTLVGLLRVRMLSMNDAHIYCSKDQLASETQHVLKLTQYYLDKFGFKDYWFQLSLWDPENKTKFIDEPENWEYAEGVLRSVLEQLQLSFTEAKGEAAFYGPKIDVQFKNIHGREETVSTIQLDFAAKSRFDLRYDDQQGRQNHEVFVIHRAPLSTHERFIAFLIELYRGKFPVWLSPTQVKLVTVGEDNVAYAKEVARQMETKGIRVELDDRNETIGKKVRVAITERVNYIITIGDEEQQKNTLAVRDREGKVTRGVSVNTFIDQMTGEIARKC